MVPYLGQTSARNSLGVAALDTRWMEPTAPTGNSSCQDPRSPHDSCTRPHQDPSGPGSWLREREARRSRLSSHAPAPAVLVLLPRTSREGVFLGKSPCLAQQQPRASQMHAHSTELCTSRARQSLLPHHCSEVLQWLWLRGDKPLVATQCSVQTDAASHSGRVFPCLWSPAARLASPHLCFITAFPATGSLRIGLVSSCFLYCSASSAHVSAQGHCQRDETPVCSSSSFSSSSSSSSLPAAVFSMVHSQHSWRRRDGSL